MQSQLEKLRGRYNNLKEHLNKAITEQQRLYHDVQASYAKTKEEMEMSHQECESEQSRTLAKMEALRKEFQEAAAEKRAAAEQQREESNAMITHLRQKLQETEKQLAAAVEKAGGLAQRLEDRMTQCDQLRKLESQAERILAKLADESERAASLNLHNALVQKLEQVRGSLASFEHLKQLKPDLNDSMEAAVVKTIEPLANSLHEALSGQNTLRDLLDRTGKNFQKELATLHTRQNVWEADKCQEVIKLAQEKTRYVTLLEAKNDQLGNLELVRLGQSEEIQELKVKVAALEAIPREDPNLAVEIAQLRDTSAKKDEKLAELQEQSKAAETSHRNTLEKLRHQLLKAEEKLQIREEQLQSAQKAADLSRQEISIEYQKKACRLEMDAERSKASEAALNEELTKVREELSWAKTIDPGAQLIKLRRELKDAEQRIANLSCKLKGVGLTTEPTGDDGLKRLEWVYGDLLAAQALLGRDESGRGSIGSRLASS
ncbi:hypothetical protein ACRALDRAFT_1071147 [Sodiomyces alcalophilus JCM 7366]|uniref:uncharacterized protein n=1 Tax=Sodiomyces alcalophilus JCM 7366 TaxID=591952 RepID=UPI0039B5F5A9